MIAEVSSIRKYIQLNFVKKCFVFDLTMMQHIWRDLLLYFTLYFMYLTTAAPEADWRHCVQTNR